MPLKAEFLQSLAALAKEEDILLVADEVQCGNGRTGKLYGYMNFDIQPDIVSTAKGLAGGLPMGATLMGEKCADMLGKGMHGSTFGGNPICAAGALNILSRLDESMFDGVKARSEYIFSSFEGAKGVKSVSGMGLMIGIETERNADDIVAECREKGILIIKAKSKLRLLPALNIDMELLKKAIEIIKEACGK